MTNALPDWTYLDCLYDIAQAWQVFANATDNTMYRYFITICGAEGSLQV